MVYGYARVSTEDQNLERQLVAIRQYVEDDRYILLRRKCESSETAEKFLKTLRYYYDETQQRIMEYLQYEPINRVFVDKGVADI